MMKKWEITLSDIPDDVLTVCATSKRGAIDKAKAYCKAWQLDATIETIKLSDNQTL